MILGRGGGVPQVITFEQVSSFDHQMSLTRGWGLGRKEGEEGEVGLGLGSCTEGGGLGLGPYTLGKHYLPTTLLGTGKDHHQMFLSCQVLHQK